MKKILCVGGSEMGKWVENIGKFEVDPHDNPLRSEVYELMELMNPKSNKVEVFYVYKGLFEHRLEVALLHALNNQQEI